MPEDRLSNEELDELRKLLPIASQLREEADYRAAQRLVLQTWRKGVIFIGGFVAGVYLLREQAGKFIVWLSH